MNRHIVKLLAKLTAFLVLVGTVGFSPQIARRVSAAQGQNMYYVSAAGSDGFDGSAGAPFATLQKAADVVAAGDTIIIEPGVYNQKVLFTHGGTKYAPITIKAAERQSAVFDAQGRSDFIFDVVNFIDGWLGGPVKYVNVRGLVFQNTTANFAARVSAGWSFEDCVFRGGGGLIERGGECYVTRCVFEDTNLDGFSGAFGQIIFKDNIIRRANQAAMSPGGNHGASKVLFTNGLVVDGLISYDNYGTGWWMDWDNMNFTVKNSTIFGNHAGMAYEGGYVADQYWAGVGLWTEGNPGPGLIENNVFYNNDCAAVGLLESGIKAPITVRNNLFVANGGGIEVRGLVRNEGNAAGKAEITGNLFKDNDSIPAWYSSGYYDPGIGLYETISGTKPSDIGVNIDGNTYDQSDSSVPLAAWKSAGMSSPVIAGGLSEIQGLLGAEQNGVERIVSFNGALANDVYRLTDISDTTDPTKMHQVDSREAEADTIDKALADAGAVEGNTAVIPVYGRLRDIENAGNGVYVMDMYDLQERHVRVATDAAGKAVLESGINPYATLSAYGLTIRLTRKDADGYTVEGVYPADSSIASVPPGVVTQIAPGSGDGLRAQYFNGTDMTTPAATGTVPFVENYWSVDNPPAGVNKNDFSVRYMGQVEPLYSEDYTFYALLDGSVRLWVNGRLIINNWTTHSLPIDRGLDGGYMGTVRLNAGQKYDIRMEYRPASASSAMSLQWESARQGKETIPQEQLYSTVDPGSEPNPPALSIDLRDNAFVSSPSLILTGITEPAYTVTACGATATADAVTGAFSVPLALAEGFSLITVESSDAQQYNISSANLRVLYFPAGVMMFEAEDSDYNVGTLYGEGTTGFSGRGFIGQNESVGDYMNFTVDAPAAGVYLLNARYVNGWIDQTKAVYANGVKYGDLSLLTTGGWDKWAVTDYVPIELKQGANQVTLKVETTPCNPGIDYITIRSAAVRYEAEDPTCVTYTQGNVFGDIPSMSGGAGVGNDGAGSVLTLTADAPEAGYYKLTVFYGNGAWEAERELSVNGTSIGILGFPGTPGWVDMGSVETTVYLEAGANTISFTVPVDNAMNILYDCFDLEPVIGELPPVILTNLDSIDNTTVSAESLDVTGSVDKTCDVRINGETVSLGGGLNFTKTVTLTPGKNTIAVEASLAGIGSASKSYTIFYVPEGTIKIEAEDTTKVSWTQGQIFEGINLSGGAGVGYDADGASITFTASVPVAGIYTLRVCYGNAYVRIQRDLSVNDVPLGKLPFPSTPDWMVCLETAPLDIHLKAGKNTIALTVPSDDVHNLFLDYITLLLHTADAFSGLAVTLDQADTVTGEDSFTLTGVVQAEEGASVTLTINGEPVALGAGNKFSHTVPLQIGDNAITVNTSDDRGHTDTAVITVKRVIKIEAEDPFLVRYTQGQVFGGMPLASGQEGVGYDAPGAEMTFTIDAPVAGDYAVVVRYGCGSDFALREILINGTSQGSITFPNTGWWTDFADSAEIPVLLSQGENAFTLVVPNYQDNLLVDYITVKLVRSGNPAVDKTALSALIAQADDALAGDALSASVAESVAALQSALTAAKSVYNDGAASKTDVDNALAALRAALDNALESRGVFACAVRSMLAKVAKLQAIPYTWDGSGTLYFTSSNRTVCDVTGSGTLVPLKAGIAVITITAPNGQKAIFAVTVTA